MSIRKVVLLSCVSQKQNYTCRARDLYKSPLFIKSLKYALSNKPDMIYILSAKYGLVDINQTIKPYDETLSKMPIYERKKWSEKVLINLSVKCNVSSDEFIILAGKQYYEFLLGKNKISNFKLPFSSLPIGKRLQFLKNEGY